MEIKYKKSKNQVLTENLESIIKKSVKDDIKIGKIKSVMIGSKFLIFKNIVSDKVWMCYIDMDNMKLVYAETNGCKMRTEYFRQSKKYLHSSVN